MNDRYSRKIYPMEGLPPEVVAVTFAKTSRVPHSFKDIARELTEDQSSKFHEKWVIGYGHSSVAEHAVLSLALENVSVLATKTIEDNRLSSYTEQSTRYQYYDRDRFYTPGNLPGPLRKVYRKTAESLMTGYCAVKPLMESYMKEKFPRDPKIGEKLYSGRIKARTCDVVRYLLPTATLTNLGWTVNARTLEHAISKFKSHPLEEIRCVGEEVKRAAKKITPVLLKYADENEYLIDSEKALRESVPAIMGSVSAESGPSVKLVQYDSDAEEKILASLLYKHSGADYGEALSGAKKMGEAARIELLDEAFGKMGKYDHPTREMEHTCYSFDVVMDYGAFRDLQRHRICTQTNQLLNTDLGFDVPEEILEIDYGDKYKECMERARRTYEELAKDYPFEAQYVVPLAFKKRTLYTMNLRELYHIVKLRTAKAGHRSYRTIAHKMAEAVKKVHPLLTKYMTDHVAENEVS